MEKSESIKNLAKALGLFQVKMDKISKDSNNPYYHSKYASLSTILEHIQLPLGEVGLCFSQFPDENGLTSILIHTETGEYMQATYSLTPVKNDPQSVGSAITYARRYALGSILGLNIDEDDDANAASKDDKPGKQQAPQPPKNDKPWLNPNTPQWTEALKFLSEGGTVEKILSKYNISTANKKLLTK